MNTYTAMRAHTLEMNILVAFNAKQRHPSRHVTQGCVDKTAHYLAMKHTQQGNHAVHPHSSYESGGVENQTV